MRKPLTYLSAIKDVSGEMSISASKCLIHVRVVARLETFLGQTLGICLN